jgi:D-glycero-D-manno-heptose 1,7-bisphosphate phosphatase
MKAVLLDRDGVINALIYHQNAGVIDAPFKRSQFKLLPRVPEAIRLLNDLGLRVVVVSNQPGIAKGHLKRETLKTFERLMLSGVRSAGGRIDATYYCLHHPEAKVEKLRQRCNCRKPEIGMLQRAAADLDVSLAECYMIGDGIPDLQAAERAGCRSIFIGRWKCEICQFTEAPHVRPALVAKSLWEAAQAIQSEINGTSQPTPSFGASIISARPTCFTTRKS